MTDRQALLRQLPAVHEVLETEAAQQLLKEVPRPLVTEAIRRALDKARQQILRGDGTIAVPTAVEVARRAQTVLWQEVVPLMPRVINATGIIVHTGLGRSLLSPHAVQRLVEAATRPCALEVDEVTGERSFRDLRVEKLLCLLTGAEAATVVNNNAAAVLLILNTLAEGREVIVSRGELVEIGGSFRIPEILRKSGAALVEVGTTNKTRLSDYERAINERTALLLKVHQSNFRIVGFTEQVTLRQLVALGRKHNLPVVEDLGSGALADVSRAGIEKEPLVQESVAAGADLVSFSGDKLLGGPQAGIVVGRKDLIAQLRHNPLYRAFRCDKLTFAALEATLLSYFDAERAWREIPTLQQIALSPQEVKRRAQKVARRLRRLGVPATAVSVRPSVSQVGGGALPDQFLPTWCVVVAPPNGDSADAFAQRLRLGSPSVFCRIQKDALWFDLRTVLPDELGELAGCIVAAWVKE
ncbi:L-seryl-tRNA(Sec) selenium transferase [bacterium HR17]|uniref:L-seryl-tRNA(Sec) selenium transferase n=1 Tax=Candidatus Fervidibacter japonicus TaxID=2035412 RepID=A0A2H5XBW7_9BACT|nr:L-seryl-tRNA(Sec) selenium transferase [bacterium HR17]